MRPRRAATSSYNSILNPYKRFLRSVLQGLTYWMETYDLTLEELIDLIKQFVETHPDQLDSFDQWLLTLQIEGTLNLHKRKDTRP